MKRFTLLSSLALCMLLTACSHSDQAAHPRYLPDDDMCGASQFQNYVGKPLTAVDDLQLEQPVRAIPAYASVSMDFILRRINFLANDKGMITRVYCG
ncbi:I78 family peptidase inhibitor [Rosenbergiella nectarea]|uniref:I78 family peptidase inhibitor n=1 Tax=Rosenbergiella nectarea TaxID=988801 RepID=UPI001BD9A452|nr:I78 family peptidase inhibitor [Rosenbergiella nectarea]MBT0729737.1 peptidase inhibitor I78 family protein [Rosenbergiella nectarea subsp. apis]